MAKMQSSCETCSNTPGSEFCKKTCIPAWEKALDTIFPKDKNVRIEDILEQEKWNSGLILPEQVQ